MPHAPRDYTAKGWPGDQAIVESFPLHTGVTGQIEMFMVVSAVLEAGAIVAQKAAAGAKRVYIAVDNYDAFDVTSATKLPVWTNTQGAIIVTPHVDTTGLAVGDELEVSGTAGVLIEGATNPVGKCLEITADDEVRVLLY